MAKARILGKSWLDDVTITATSEALAVENLQDTDVRKVHRTTGTTAQVYTADFGEAKACNGIHLENINLRDDATIQLELSNVSNYATTVLDTTFSPWSQELTFRAATKFFTEVSARYFRLTLNDGGSPDNPDGYLEIGRIKIGDWVEAARDLSFGASLGYQERGALVQARGGSWRGQQKTPIRVVSGQWDWLTDSEAYELMEFLRITGYRDDVVVSLYPEAGGSLERVHTVLGFLTDRGPLERYTVAGYSGSTPIRRSRFPFTISESV